MWGTAAYAVLLPFPSQQNVHNVAETLETGNPLDILSLTGGMFGNPLQHFKALPRGVWLSSAP